MPLILPANTLSAAYDVDNSCRFNDGDSPKFERTLGTASDRKKFTFSLWFKRGALTQNSRLLEATDGTGSSFISIDSSDRLEMYMDDGSSNEQGTLVTTRKFRDCSAWYHAVFVWDSANGTAGNRMRIYVNGVEETVFTTDNNPDQNDETQINEGVEHNIGSQIADAQFFDGYMAEVVFCDGQAYAASDFGEFDSASPTIWKPKDVSGLTFGNNGFYLDFEGGADTVFSDASSNDFTITRAGDTRHSPGQAKFGGTSFYFDGTGDELKTEVNSAFARGTGDWTLEFWLYKTKSQTDESVVIQQDDNTLPGFQAEYSSSKLTLYNYELEDDWTAYGQENAAASNDAWHHYAFVRASNVHTLYVDGTAQTTTATSESSHAPDTNFLRFGAHRSDSSRYLDGVYIDEIRFSDNARYTSNFSVATDHFTSDGNTIVLIQSTGAASSTLGSDKSGNADHFTPTNLVSTDQCTDTPTNNFCTLNPLDAYYTNSTFSEGNTMFASGSSYTDTPANILLTAGKWYWEVNVISKTGDTDNYIIGIGSVQHTATNQASLVSATGYQIYGVNGQIYNNNSGSTYAAAYAAGDIIGVALDLTNSKLYFSKDGAWADGSGSWDSTTFDAAVGAISITAPASTPLGGYVPSQTFWSGSGATFKLNFGNPAYATLPMWQTKMVMVLLNMHHLQDFWQSAQKI